MIPFVFIQYYTHYTMIITYPVHKRQVLVYQLDFVFLFWRYDCFLIVWCKKHYAMLFCILLLLLDRWRLSIDNWFCLLDFFSVSWSYALYGSHSFVQEQSLTVDVLERIIFIKVGLDHLICNSLEAFKSTGWVT